MQICAWCAWYSISFGMTKSQGVQCLPMLPGEAEAAMKMMHGCPHCIPALCIDQKAAVLDCHPQRPVHQIALHQICKSQAIQQSVSYKAERHQRRLLKTRIFTQQSITGSVY